MQRFITKAHDEPLGSKDVLKAHGEPWLLYKLEQERVFDLIYFKAHGEPRILCIKVNVL